MFDLASGPILLMLPSKDHQFDTEVGVWGSRIPIYISRISGF